ncbi:MAG: NADH-quinone oxidoreductase subunit J [Bacteroidetes bacterium]|jgi:NADH-quinone oxidoreductase subunit J|nr:NADH-quinone oxidoreductase subunit J [Bacteroidota bacterium]
MGHITITQILFGVLSFVAIISGVLMIFTKNPIYSVLYLIITFFAIAGHYILLNAQFLAVVHVIVYAGAIMVLFLFVIMMLNLNKDTEPHKPAWIQIAAVTAGGIMMVTLVGALKGADQMKLAQPNDANIGLVNNLGKVLFNDFLVPFELSSVLFLAAMVGAVMLSKKNIH